MPLAHWEEQEHHQQRASTAERALLAGPGFITQVVLEVTVLACQVGCAATVGHVSSACIGACRMNSGVCPHAPMPRLFTRLGSHLLASGT